MHIATFYAPHMGKQPNGRIKFFEDMSDELKTKTRYKELVALGDFNARLHARREDEENVIGSFVFGRGKNYLEKVSRDNDSLNRELLATVVVDNELRVINTFFEKSDDKLITHRIPGTKPMHEINAIKFATTDHTLGYS